MGSFSIPPKLAYLAQALNKREQINQLRVLPEVQSKETPFIQLKGGQILVDFASNDYLGLNKNLASIQTHLSSAVSSTSSRLLGGDSQSLQTAELQIASIFGNQLSCTIFPSTWQANASIIPALVGRHDLIITDKYAHNSLINAAKLSGATLIRYKHNDIADLKRLLKKNRDGYKNCLIVTESVFSMHGSLLDFHAFLECCNDFEAISYVDEAHAFGVFGEMGIGLIPKEFAVDVRVGALGKAAASSGGFVICSSFIRNYLANFADGLIYSTAISPHHASIIECQIATLKEASKQRSHLYLLLEEAKQLLITHGINFNKDLSHIIPIPVGDDAKCIRIKEWLLQKGYWVAAIRPPTVPKGQACIRISLTAKHTLEQLQAFTVELVNAIKHA